MNDNWLERTELLLGKEKLSQIRDAHVLVVGLGGVGAYAAEMIARAGVGRMTVADADTVNPTNINRQLVALHSTVGRQKAEVLAERLRDINPAIGLTVVNRYIKDEETYTLLDAARYDYVVDAIDTLSPKLALIAASLERGYPLVSSMGAGAKTALFDYTDPVDETITINGQNAAATVQNGDAALSKTALGDAAQLRVIANQGGNWRAAAIWYTADQGSEITLSDSNFLYSGSEDGYLEPDDAFLENVALNYYKAFLNAVNDHDLSEMRFSTARNTDEQSSHVFSDLNAGNTYDTSTASCTLDDSSITWGTYSLTVNVSYMCVREDRDTAVREINSNHRTICMVWQDGMWQVDDIAFLSDDDFAAHKYADLNK